jgi:protein-tyrosine phosphatase
VIDDGLRSGPLRLLLLCEANVCRSPAAAALLSTRLRAARVDGDALVRSAGVRTEPGLPVHAYVVAALRSVGVVVGDGKCSARFTPRTAGESDVLLTATAAVRDAAIRKAPSVRDRAFTWLEFLALVPDEQLALPGATPRARWAALMQQARQARGLVRSAPGEFDVQDPIGMPRADFDRMVAEVDVSMTALASLVSKVVRD